MAEMEGSTVKRCSASFSACFNLGTGIHEDIHRFDIVLYSSTMKRRSPSGIVM